MVNKRLLAAQPFKGKIAVVSGGSKGIGKETARQIVQLGGSVCLIARGAEALAAAAAEIKSARQSEEQFVEHLICDATDFDVLKPLLDSFIETHGTPNYLINVVGYAYPEYIDKLTITDFKQNMDVNYYGQVVPLLILLPHFIEAQRGHIAFVSSLLGFMGIMGYAAYAPSKYALVGLAEVVRHELKPHNIHVSLLYPPDTDTPGFEIENQTKPPETAMLSETAKLLSPEQVAEKFIDGLLKKKFHIAIGEVRWIRPLMQWFPRLVHWIIDQDYQKARKKLGKHS